MLKTKELWCRTVREKLPCAEWLLTVELSATLSQPFVKRVLAVPFHCTKPLAKTQYVPSGSLALSVAFAVMQCLCLGSGVGSRESIPMPTV